jgi:SAM-dependent methyltransferase
VNPLCNRDAETNDGSCPVCDSDSSQIFLERHNVPTHQNLPYATRAQAVGSTRGMLRMRACAHCGFIWNAAFDPSLVQYGPAYDNTQRHSPVFDAHMRDLAARIIDRDGVRNARIFEVGCGKGDFLRLLIREESAANVGVGFDPTHVGPDEEFGGRLRFEHRFFDGACIDMQPDVVICRHVIEHVADPLHLLRELKLAIGQRDVRLYFETPDVEWILRNEVIWDFFYEHCSLFTAESLAAAFARAGFRLSGIDRVFGEQYLWVEATTTSSPTEPVWPGVDAMLAHRFGDVERQLAEHWTRRIEALRERGPVALWGGGAKGVTLANLCDPDGERIECVVDINPEKQGRYIAGTGHLVVAPSALRERGVQYVVLLNPNYADEVRIELKRLGLSCELVAH